MIWAADRPTKGRTPSPPVSLVFLLQRCCRMFVSPARSKGRKDDRAERIKSRSPMVSPKPVTPCQDQPEEVKVIITGWQQDITTCSYNNGHNALQVRGGTLDRERGSILCTTWMRRRRSRPFRLEGVHDLSPSGVLDIVPVEELPLKFMGDAFVFRVLGTCRDAPGAQLRWDDPPPPSAERPRRERYDPPNAGATDWTRPGMPGVLGKWCKRPQQMAGHWYVSRCISKSSLPDLVSETAN